MATRARKTTSASKTRAPKTLVASTYDQFKEFQGQRYTGMKVGRRHTWRYDAGEWTEKKITPDRWEFQYAVVKRRHGKAPEGTGAPVGTAYRWYILAEQVVTKRDANSYMTEMRGIKYKVAHRRADKDSWSASDRAQRKRMTALLHETAEELEAEPPKVPSMTAIDTTAAEARPRRKPARRKAVSG